MIQRYKLRQGKLRKDDAGEWVRREDAEAIAAALEAENKLLKDRFSKLCPELEDMLHDKNQKASGWYWKDGRLFIRVSKSLRYGSRLANEQEEALIREVERLRERSTKLEAEKAKAECGEDEPVADFFEPVKYPEI